MSHIETVAVVMTDVAAIKAACARLGVTFAEGQKTYKWFGQSMGDYPLPDGMTASDLGKCDHAIKVPGVSYEVGLVRRKDGPGYTLAFDFWGGDTQGGGLQKKLCKRLPNGSYSKGMEPLVDAYSVETLKRIAARKGFRSIESVAADGSIKLVVQR